MELTVVGAGLGRTGTTSLKLALERVTDGRCYHMFEVLERPEHVPLWHTAVCEEKLDSDALLADYRASVDWPAAAFWPELAAENPDALVLLSTRSTADAWWASMEKTIIVALTAPPPPGNEGREAHRAMVIELFERRFTPDWRDPAAAMAAYERHNARVRSEVPPERLLEWQPGDGWAPICARLGVAVPAEPFPHENRTADFQANLETHAD